MDGPGTPPDVYSDVFDFDLGPYGVTLNFARNRPRQPAGKPQPPEDVAVVRMSLQQAKVLSLLLRQSLSKYERENGAEVTLPKAVYTSLGISPDDWPGASG
jgi:hypothetical protein